MKVIQFQVAGTKWHWEDFTQAKVQRGDLLTLKPEPSNTHDSKAVAVYKGGQHIGYVPRTYNQEVGEALAEGKVDECRVFLNWATGCDAIVKINE